ncbi:hypothetical protein CR105_25595 [Massilia eurypsychrophila]|uniref:Uncharacterized protein n=1 Tax=Massilia eurypsychrophila TaxID=1485217 RepID=A0A2G8T812_9BURK|nr:DUF3223 domain-containing protein [Massilia eurypsychrophila]PIL42181.1 hypothetical protein CR105_25595 [Massilia eurypsychrophila]
MTRGVSLQNGLSWKRSGDALDHFQQMLDRYSVGEQISSPQDVSDLAALLERYDSMLLPGEATKIGAGILFFSKQTNNGEGWSSDSFWVHRTDATSSDFSYKKALGPLRSETKGRRNPT